MKKTIGIPRALYYYDFYPIWKEYFNNLGYETILSPKTNKDILNKGILSCVDEACLPIKIFHGHVEYLKDKVDYVFIPNIMSLSKREYNCPKHLGIAQMIRNSIVDLPEIIAPIIRLEKNNGLKFMAKDIEKQLGTKSNIRLNQYKNRQSININYDEWLKENIIPKNNIKDTDFNILVLGHSYNIYDEFINMNILKKLYEKNINIIFPHDVSEELYRSYSNKFNKRIFWTAGRKLVGSAIYLIEKNLIDGIIYLNSFGCGLDSMLLYLVENICIDENIPIVVITLDEQTGEAGLVTRVEAFVDMMKWRKTNENNFSPSR